MLAMHLIWLIEEKYIDLSIIFPTCDSTKKQSVKTSIFQAEKERTRITAIELVRNLVVFSFLLFSEVVE